MIWYVDCESPMSPCIGALARQDPSHGTLQWLIMSSFEGLSEVVVRSRSWITINTRTRASTLEGEAIPASKAQFMGEVMGPTQPSSVLNNTLMLHELIVRLLDRLDSIPLSCVLPGTSCSPMIVGATPPIGTLRFDDTTGDKAYDFLTECQDRLFNLGILEAHGMLILLISSHEWPRSGGGRYSLIGQLVLVTPRAYTLNVIGTREPFLIPKKTLGLAT
ncbi:hypothetical protein KY289_016351 [Solanum tuberosum]|nr:hypothetical protein KY289_016351 [Solanum tuberosum]